MSKRHGAREQKRRAKQKAKRDVRHGQLARRNSADPTIRLSAADRWPIVATLVPQSLRTIGLGSCIISRRLPDGQLAVAVFLVDVYCLGVKDAMWTIVLPSEFQEMRDQIDQRERLKPVAPEYFAKLVYQAADYGQSLGFPPHRDFAHAQRLMAGIDPSQCSEEFEFGKDGKPFYLCGPYESPERVRTIANRITQLGGTFVPPPFGTWPGALHLLSSESDSYDAEYETGEYEDDECEERECEEGEAGAKIDCEDDQPPSKTWLRWW